MKKYIVQSPVTYGTTATDQRTYAIGEPIELDDKDAAPLLRCGAIAAAKGRPKAADADE